MVDALFRVVDKVLKGTVWRWQAGDYLESVAEARISLGTRFSRGNDTLEGRYRQACADGGSNNGLIILHPLYSQTSRALTYIIPHDALQQQRPCLNT